MFYFDLLYDILIFISICKTYQNSIRHGVIITMVIFATMFIWTSPTLMISLKWLSQWSMDISTMNGKRKTCANKSAKEIARNIWRYLANRHQLGGQSKYLLNVKGQKLTSKKININTEVFLFVFAVSAKLIYRSTYSCLDRDNLWIWIKYQNGLKPTPHSSVLRVVHMFNSFSNFIVFNIAYVVQLAVKLLKLAWIRMLQRRERIRTRMLLVKSSKNWIGGNFILLRTAFYCPLLWWQRCNYVKYTHTVCGWITFNYNIVCK